MKAGNAALCLIDDIQLLLQCPVQDNIKGDVDRCLQLPFATLL